MGVSESWRPENLSRAQASATGPTARARAEDFAGRPRTREPGPRDQPGPLFFSQKRSFSVERIHARNVLERVSVDDSMRSRSSRDPAKTHGHRMDARDDVRGHEMGRRDGRRRARKAILEERVLPGGVIPRTQCSAQCSAQCSLRTVISARLMFITYRAQRWFDVSLRWFLWASTSFARHPFFKGNNPKSLIYMDYHDMKTMMDELDNCITLQKQWEIQSHPLLQTFCQRRFWGDRKFYFWNWDEKVDPFDINFIWSIKNYCTLFELDFFLFSDVLKLYGFLFFFTLFFI